MLCRSKKNLKTVVGIWDGYVSTSTTVGKKKSVLYLMCATFHWAVMVFIFNLLLEHVIEYVIVVAVVIQKGQYCTYQLYQKEKEQQSNKIMDFDGRSNKESNFVSFLLLFSANLIGHNVSFSCSFIVWKSGESLSLIMLAVLRVSLVVFLCDPNTFPSTLLKECGHIWPRTSPYVVWVSDWQMHPTCL